MTNEQIIDIRRQMLAKWIEDNYEGKGVQARFINDLNKDLPLDEKPFAQAVIAGLLNRNKDNPRTFGEKMARRIERAAGMPHLYLDSLTTQKIIKMADPDSMSKTLLSIYEKLTAENKLALHGIANDLLTKQGTEKANKFVPYDQQKVEQ